MGLLEFLFVCIVVGLAVWFINTFLPLPGQIKTLILWAAVAVLVLILLRAMGVLGGTDVAIPRIN